MKDNNQGDSIYFTLAKQNEQLQENKLREFSPNRCPIVNDFMNKIRLVSTVKFMA